MTHSPIQLSAPFESDFIPSGRYFDVVSTEEIDGRVLVSYEGIRVWKPKAHIEGKAMFWRTLPASMLSVPYVQAKQETMGQLSPLERYALKIQRERALAVQLQTAPIALSALG